MRIIIIGTGNVGSIYGWALAAAGHEVTHLVRRGKGNLFPGGMEVDILDERKGHLKRHRECYAIRISEEPPTDGCDLVLAAVKAHQLNGVLNQWGQRLAPAPFLLMTPAWQGREAIDAMIPGRAVFSDSQSGGSFRDGVIVGCLGRELPLGKISDTTCQAEVTIRELFVRAGFEIEEKPDILKWNWVQHASNAGLWPALVQAGSFRAVFRDFPLFERGLAAARECLEVCEKRGIDLIEHPEVSIYRGASRFHSWLVFKLMKLIVLHRESIKRMSAHALEDPREIEAAYQDLLSTGRSLGLPMTAFGSFEGVVRGFAAAAPTRRGELDESRSLA